MQYGDLAPGSRFGRYTIEKVIGRGGMGVVYSAREDGLNRVVALKVIAPELVRDEAFRVRFLREGRVAAGLEHPNIVPVFAADEVDGQPYIAMRYVPGTDLKSLLASVGRLDPPRALAIFTPLADALDVANDQGLVHRDVKPANILVGPDGYDGHPRVYLTDLGLTRETAGSALTQQGMLVGTVEYMAPEQVEGRSLDGAADQYALAASLYESLTGRLPFEAGSLTALLVAKLRDLPPLPSALRPELGADFDRVMERAMALAPDVRYPSCVAFVRAARLALPEFIAPPVRGRTVIEPIPVPLPTIERDDDTREREAPPIPPDADTRERPVPPAVLPVAADVPEAPVPSVDPGAETRERPVPPLPEPAVPDEPVVDVPVAATIAGASSVAAEPDVDEAAAEDPVVAEPEASEPAADPEPVAEAEAVPEPEPAAELEPVTEPEPIDEPEPISETAPIAAATAVAATPPDGSTRVSSSESPRTVVRPSDAAAPPLAREAAPRPGPERKPPAPPGRRNRGVLIGGGLAAVAIIGVVAAMAVAGGGGSGDKDTTAAAPGTTGAASTTGTTAGVPVAAGTTTDAATTAPVTTAPTTSTGNTTAPPHATDTPKEGWTPTTPTDLFAFARTPQDGVVDYNVPAAKLRYKVVKRGSDLVVDVRFQQGDYAREWARFKGKKLVNACLQPRGEALRCGSTAAQLGLSATEYQVLLDVRRGYFDRLVTLDDLQELKENGTVTDVRLDQKLGFPIVCAEPAAKDTSRMCVQENGFVTQWQSGKTRITATAVRPGATAADLRRPT